MRVSLHFSKSECNRGTASLCDNTNTDALCGRVDNYDEAMCDVLKLLVQIGLRYQRQMQQHSVVARRITYSGHTFGGEC